MMNERQRAIELEQLSAYLDGQLNENEQRQIESRLTSEPELQEIYEGLRNTKLLFKRLRKVRAPRSFALTPEMVKVRKKKQSFFTSVRWATSLAAMLLVVMFGVEFIQGSRFAARSEMAEAPMYDTVNIESEEALAQEAPNEKAAVEPLILWGAPSSGGGGDIATGIGGGAGDAEILDTAPIEPSGGGGETPQYYPTEPPSIMRTMDGGEGEDLILGINADQAGEIIYTSEEPLAKSSSSWLANLTPLRWAEIGLGVLVLTGLILLLVRKRA